MSGYSARDLGLAAFLAHQGHTYEMERDEEGSVWFSFGPEARKLKRGYFSGTASVEPRSFYGSLRRLKAEVFWLGRSGM